MGRKYGAAFLTALVASMPLGSFAQEHRSREVTREFQVEHPCPSTGSRYGACPGWIKDHINPLCHGGPDSVSNMQWQTVTDAKIKDRWERQLCAAHGLH